MSPGQVSVKIAGHAREYFPGGRDEFALDLDAAVSVRELLSRLGVSTELVMAVFVDGQLVDKDTTVAPGANVILVTPPSGG
jgi:molybdopterin converting factor small subunit